MDRDKDVLIEQLYNALSMVLHKTENKSHQSERGITITHFDNGEIWLIESAIESYKETKNEQKTIQ